MKLTYLALLTALGLGVGIGVTVRPADAQQMRPLTEIVGGPLVPAGASANAVWVLDASKRVIYSCTNPSSPSCAKAQLP